METESKTFEFIDPGPLTDDELELVLVEAAPAHPARDWLPAYLFEMRVNGRKAGDLSLRVGYTEGMVMHGGNIGYAVEPEHRGHHYAERACRLVLPLAKAHGMDTIWITCSPTNIASRRTRERLGSTFVELADLPTDHPMYEGPPGRTQSCRYRIDLD